MPSRALVCVLANGGAVEGSCRQSLVLLVFQLLVATVLGIHMVKVNRLDMGR